MEIIHRKDMLDVTLMVDSLPEEIVVLGLAWRQEVMILVENSLLEDSEMGSDLSKDTEVLIDTITSHKDKYCTSVSMVMKPVSH